jgi:polar amino acid transport system ATP-binding protein
MICVENLSLTKTKHRERKTLLHSLSLEIPSNRITVFLGKSGSGKSSLLRCLTHVESEYEGAITCLGKNLKIMPPKDRCQLLGFVPQGYALFPFMTVLDNCAHPLQKVLGFSKEQAYKKVEKEAASLGMQQFLHAYPHELSGGQQQRVTIIRAILQGPMFLLFDEPTSALDPENTSLFIQILKQLKKEGKGIVIASHDMPFVEQICENVYFLEQGHIVEHCDIQTVSEIEKDSRLGKFLRSSNQEVEESVLL